MKQGRKYTFNIEEMLTLRISDPIFWNLSRLGRKYGKDHTTIRYHCIKFGVDIGDPKIIHIPPDYYDDSVINQPTEHIGPPKTFYKYDSLLYEKISRPKSYRQLLREAKQREPWYKKFAPYRTVQKPPRIRNKKNQTGSEHNAESPEMAQGV